MLTTRELATLARQNKLDADPLIRIRVRQEEDRLLAAAMVAKTEAAAALDFEQSRRRGNGARASSTRSIERGIRRRKR